MDKTVKQKINDIRDFFNNPPYVIDLHLLDLIHTSVEAMKDMQFTDTTKPKT